MTKTEIKTYKSFTWQKVKVLSDEIGVKFYSGSSSYAEYGIGFRIDRWDDTKINIIYRRESTGDTYYEQKYFKLQIDYFWQTLELYFLKKGIQYEIGEKKDYIRIVEE